MAKNQMTLSKGTCMNDQKANEKILNIINPENAN